MQTHNTIDIFRSLIRGKTRVALAWIFSAILVFSTRKFPQWHGMILCFLGASLRFWASGYLRKDNRPAVGGPYAYVRNPLYLGTYLMAVGAVLSVENWWLLGILTLVFAMVYHYIILDEETKLQEIFGEPYKKYCELVPRFFPRIFPPSQNLNEALKQINPEESHHQFSYPLAQSNKAFEAFLTFVGLICFLAIIASFWRFF